MNDKIFDIIARNFIFFVTTLFLFVSFYYFGFKKVKSNKIIKGCKGNNCRSHNCYGRYCQTTWCDGDKCKAGNCIGEKCLAGGCRGTQCRAGDCYGYACKPGTCYDPKCPKETCPQQYKNCIDGKKLIIKQPFYWGLTKMFPNDTKLNPPICENKYRLRDLIEGRAQDLPIKSVHFKNKVTVPIETLFDKKKMNNLGLKQTTEISSTDPKIFKNKNCDLCVISNGKRICSKTSNH